MSAPKRKKSHPKKKGVVIDSAADFEKLLKKKRRGKENYLLRLYITGITLRSTETISVIRALCEDYLKGHYELEVVDIYQQPEQAQGEQIIAAPTLIKKFPLPVKRIVGNL